MSTPRDPNPPLEPDTTRFDAVREASSSQIGPYLLLRRVGEGGMGEVWLAQQQHPVRRQVALKVIKAGRDTREVPSGLGEPEAPRRSVRFSVQCVQVGKRIEP